MYSNLCSARLFPSVLPASCLVLLTDIWLLKLSIWIFAHYNSVTMLVFLLYIFGVQMYSLIILHQQQCKMCFPQARSSFQLNKHTCSTSEVSSSNYFLTNWLFFRPSELQKPVIRSIQFAEQYHFCKPLIKSNVSFSRLLIGSRL